MGPQKNPPLHVITLDNIFIFSSSLQVRKPLVFLDAVENASIACHFVHENTLLKNVGKIQKCWKNGLKIYSICPLLLALKMVFESSKCTLKTFLWKCLRLVLVSFKCCRNVEVPVIWNFNISFWSIKLIWFRNKTG